MKNYMKIDFYIEVLFLFRDLLTSFIVDLRFHLEPGPVNRFSGYWNFNRLNICNIINPLCPLCGTYYTFNVDVLFWARDTLEIHITVG